MRDRLLNDIRNMQDNTHLRTTEILDTGEQNNMTFVCSKEHLLDMINSCFNDNLQGAVPNGLPTTIVSWEFIVKEGV